MLTGSEIARQKGGTAVRAGGSEARTAGKEMVDSSGPPSAALDGKPLTVTIDARLVTLYKEWMTAHASPVE